MELFARCDREPERLLAVTEEGKRYTLGDLNAAAERIAGAVGGHRLVFVLCENTPGTLLGYLGCLKSGEVPLLLDAHIAPELLRGLLETYRPAFVHVPGDLPAETGRVLEGFVPALEVEDSVLLRRPGGQGPELHPELALLLTTSGSTGSPKLVRLSGRNLDANTRSIVEYLELDEGQRPVTNLAMSYSYGMSIVNTHLLAGAALVLTRRSVLERPFWELVERERVTSLAGVPYTYRMYRRAGLLEMELPALNTLTQAGGKLPEALHLEFADWAARTGRRFFVMYGQTEAAPRMGYLPAERAVEKCGSMGVPVPGGQFRLLGEDGAPIDAPDTVGELVYRGPNVAMGYARRAEELALGDEWHGELHTGDMARLVFFRELCYAGTTEQKRRPAQTPEPAANRGRSRRLTRIRFAPPKRRSGISAHLRCAGGYRRAVRHTAGFVPNREGRGGHGNRLSRGPLPGPGPGASPTHPVCRQ